MYRRQKKWIKPGFIIVLLLLFSSFWFLVRGLFWSFVIDTEVTVRSGDTMAVFYRVLSDWQVKRVKWYIRTNAIDMSGLEVGEYRFVGSYSPSSFVAHVLAGSEKNFLRMTVLEGWSIFDIDDHLFRQGFINKGQYISYVTNRENIAVLQGSYDFLAKAWSINSLEGFLYPDTYFLDQNVDIVPTLVRTQLDTFNRRVWLVIQDDIGWFYRRLGQDFPRVNFSWHDIMKLASVVQKEERIVANQSTIAGLFLRRLQLGMRIDADITLCYGLKQPYSVCTPSYIARHVSDRNNVYNTRQRQGLPPSIIANIPLSAIQSVLAYVISDYLYYLHDSRGRIHYGSTLDEHNRNKKQYLR
jgi:UPF0755 protein